MNFETENVLIKKANGESEPFDSEKLKRSLIKSGASPRVSEMVAEHIQGEIKDGMDTAQIYKHAFFLLHKMERPTAIRYSLRKAIMELGPSGFPFEKFVAQILQAKGYEVRTDQMMKGFCVDHEVDVVAWNDKKLIMAEAKFHNQMGLKSDLKVALYVKARFDDLKKASFLIGGEKRYLDEGWLITNTKFSETAIHYGKCQGLKMIGWSYPDRESLQALVEDGDLHPITCLTTLNQSEKNALLLGGTVLCNAIFQDKSVLSKIGLPAERVNGVLEEIGML